MDARPSHYLEIFKVLFVKDDLRGLLRFDAWLRPNPASALSFLYLSGGASRVSSALRLKYPFHTWTFVEDSRGPY